MSHVVELKVETNGMPLTPQNPQGRLMSKFMLQLATPFLLLKSGSVAKPTHPRGLFSLVMAAVSTRNLNVLLLNSAHLFRHSWNAPFVHAYKLITSRISPMITGDRRSSAIIPALLPSMTTDGKKSWMRATTIPCPKMRTTRLTYPYLILTVQFYSISAAPKRRDHIFASIFSLNLLSI
jgi:hypothetical protein